jgi:hypothetical protein
MKFNLRDKEFKDYIYKSLLSECIINNTKLDSAFYELYYMDVSLIEDKDLLKFYFKLNELEIIYHKHDLIKEILLNYKILKNGIDSFNKILSEVTGSRQNLIVTMGLARDTYNNLLWQFRHANQDKMQNTFDLAIEKFLDD